MNSRSYSGVIVPGLSWLWFPSQLRCCRLSIKSLEWKRIFQRKSGQESVLENHFYANEVIHLFLDFIKDSEGNKYIFRYSFLFRKKGKYRFMQIHL